MSFEAGKIYSNGAERRLILACDASEVRWATPITLRESVTPRGEFDAWHAAGGPEGPVSRPGPPAP